jgi:hypothetical protein
MKKLILSILIVGTTIVSNAQNPMLQQIVEDILESSGENMSDNTDFQDILDDLIRFSQSPLKINTASGKELAQLHLLSSSQIDNLISFRQKTGTIYSIYEMVSIEGFTADVLQRIEPFISFDIQNQHIVRTKSMSDLFLRSSRSFFSEDMPETMNYEGSPERYYLRFRHASAAYECGLVAEKDPGESFFRLSNKQGFDYNSAFINFRPGKADNRIFVGDYSVRFGQGLVAWQGFSMGKSVETTQIFRPNQGIRSYSSTDENQFFRGLGAQLKFQHFVFSPFISLNRVDAHLDTLAGKDYFGAFQTSGYHRTESEINGENAVSQFTAGGNVSYSYNRWVFGITSVFNRFNTEMIHDDNPYNQFLPDGKENLVSGFEWKGSVNKLYLFGEAAVSANSGKALLTGAMIKPASNAELSLVYRNINKTYFSYFSNAFTESSRINDEHSMYVGLKFFPAAHWNVFAYVDLFRNKWIKYTTAAPSIGTELFFQLSYNPTRKASFYLRFFQEDKDQKVILNRIKYNEKQLINRLRFNYAQVLNEQFSMKSRIEFSFYSKETSEKGLLIFQDVVYKPSKKLFSLNGRLVYFCTDGYDSRLYAYENDVLYSFSVPALFGEGFRSYLNLQYTFYAKLTLWLKLATTHQFAQTSSEQTTVSSTKSEIKIQLRYQF